MHGDNSPNTKEVQDEIDQREDGARHREYREDRNRRGPLEEQHRLIERLRSRLSDQHRRLAGMKSERKRQQARLTKSAEDICNAQAAARTAEAERDTSRALLQDCEWVNVIKNGVVECPSCNARFGPGEPRSHKPKCLRKAELDAAEGDQ